MYHRVTAKLISSKVPNGEISGVTFFNNPKYKESPIPQMAGIRSDAGECQMTYQHVTNVEIDSSYFMYTKVESESDNEIEDIAKGKFDLVIDNLSFLFGDFWGEYKIVKIETWVKDTWKNVVSPFSTAIRCPAAVDPIILDAKEQFELNKLLEIDNNVYWKSLTYLSKGEKRLNRDLIRGEDRIDVDVFLNLFKPIELISNDVSKGNFCDIPNKLIFNFLKRVIFDGKDKAIKQLISEYGIIRLENLPSKIKKTGEILNINNVVIGRAINYNKIRSKFDIAHAHKKVSHEKIDYKELSSVARNFVKKYLTYKN